MKVVVGVDGDISYEPLSEEELLQQKLDAEAWETAQKNRVVTLSKYTLFLRTTDAEAVAVEKALETQSVRLRMMWNAANMLNSQDALWPLLLQTATHLFGPERAAELLAHEDL